MPEYTTNYNLIKPLEEEYYNINQFNDNMDTIDTVLKSTNDSLGNDYLPLSAGENKKITNDLHFSIPVGGDINLVFDNSSGVPVAKLYVGEDTMTLCQLDSDGTLIRGIHMYPDNDTSGTTALFTNNGNIVFRPQKQTATNQVWIDANGLFHNNYNFYYTSGSNVSVNSATVQCGRLTIPRGFYIVIGMLESGGAGGSTSSTSIRCRLDVAGWCQDIEIGPYGTNFSKYACSCVMAGYQQQLDIVLSATVNGAATIRNWWLRAVRLGYA